MEIADYKDSLLSLIESLETVYLSTLDTEGFPSTRAMLNLKNKGQYSHLAALHKKEKNPFTIYLTTNTSSVKMKEIVLSNKACLYFCDASNYRGITLRGKIEIIIDKNVKRKVWMEGWEIYYPGGVNSEDFALLRFIPDKLKSYGDLNITTGQLD